MALQLVGAERCHGAPPCMRCSFSACVMLTLAVLAVALVAVARGISVWVAYPAAALATAAIGSVLGVAIDPYPFLPRRPPPPLHAVIVRYLYFLSLLFPSAVLYVMRAAPPTAQRSCAPSRPNGRPRQSAWPSNACRPSLRRSTTTWC